MTDEIALNPRYFHDRPVTEVLSTLAHEMVHLWQHHYGKPGRGRYHNRQWAERMKAIGLQPSSTGKEGGQETGDAVITTCPGRPLRRGRSELLARGFAITWTEKPPAAAKNAGRRSRRRRTSRPAGTQERQARQIHLPAAAG